jgi:hypothetical protein
VVFLCHKPINNINETRNCVIQKEAIKPIFAGD